MRMRTIENVGIAIANGFTKNLDVSAITVFLAGGSLTSTNSIRPLLRKELRRHPYVRGFDVLYPEQLFDELLLGKGRHDLLELENMLAKSTHAIIIIVESSGSIAELGAFVNSDALRPKVVAIIDKKHRSDRSFIMLGPVATLRKIRREAVITHDFKQLDPKKLAENIRRVTRLIVQDTTVNDTLNNPIRAQYFFLASIFVTQPVNSATLIKMLEATGECNAANTSMVGITALNMLIRQKDATREANKYIISEQGSQRLSDIMESSRKKRQLVQLFDKCRVDVLNVTLRKSKRRDM